MSAPFAPEQDVLYLTALVKLHYIASGDGDPRPLDHTDARAILRRLDQLHAALTREAPAPDGETGR